MFEGSAALYLFTPNGVLVGESALREMAEGWRLLLLFLSAGALVLVAAVAANERARQTLLCGAWEMVQISQPPQPVAQPSARTVEDFVADLSAEERAGWLGTPRYTDTGFRVEALPSALRRELQAFHRGATPAAEECGPRLRGRVLLSSLAGSALEDGLRQHLAGSLEEWTGARDLRFENSYGPRTYARGASLGAHGDRVHSHALSAIVFVHAAGLDAPWPLQFVPNRARGQDRVQDVFLDEQHDVLLYESTQPHGRVDALRGDSFTAVFFHWQPAGWAAHVTALLGE